MSEAKVDLPVECPPRFPREAWPAYSAWVRAGDRSTRSVWPLVKEVFFAGARAEADSRTEGRAPAALEVAELIDGFGQMPQLVDEDQAHFAGIAAEIYVSGQPWRRRVGLVWRLLRPQWVDRLANWWARKGGA